MSKMRDYGGDPEDFNFVYFDDGKDEEYDDEYDRYEDYVMDTGNDYLGMFDDDHELTVKQAVKRSLRAIACQIRHVWKWHTNAKYRASWDDIPF